jgi:hypothetical protein
MMPKKKNQESPAEQSERFRRDAQKLIDAGELDPTDAKAALEKMVSQQRKR